MQPARRMSAQEAMEKALKDYPETLKYLAGKDVAKDPSDWYEVTISRLEDEAGSKDAEIARLQAELTAERKLADLLYEALIYERIIDRAASIKAYRAARYTT